LRDHTVSPCGPCGDCNIRTTPCENDDDVAGLVERMVRADALIYAAPVHGFGMAHLMQVFLERAGVGYLRFDRPLANKLGGAVVTGRRYSHSQVHAQVLNNLLPNRTIVVGSGYPVQFTGGSPGDALRDQEGLDALESMIERMVDFVDVLASRDGGGLGSLPVPSTANERVSQPQADDVARLLEQHRPLPPSDAVVAEPAAQSPSFFS
jgi:multimeric flavodoxin WrbA